MPTLYRKYRPKRWSDVAGQAHIVTTLTNALKNNLLAQAYLFTGPRGTGKTTVARLLATSINCADREKSQEPCGICAHCRAFEENRALDVIEIDGASNNSVDDIRELRETVKLPPTLGTKKIYIIDEVHMLSPGAWNALLKTLEEPPAHIVFILATTELHKIPETILSRCQRFDFTRFTTETIIAKLSRIAKEEGVTIDPDALEMIALSAEGGMRDAESLLAQAISLEDSHITGEEASAILGISERKTVFDFVSALGKRDLDASILTLESLAETGIDFRSFAGALTHFLREILFLKLGKNAQNAIASHIFPEERDALGRLAALFSFPELARLMELVHHARKEIRFASIQHLPLEIAALTFIFPKDENTASLAPSASSKETLPSPTSSPHASPIPPKTDTPHPIAATKEKQTETKPISKPSTHLPPNTKPNTQDSTPITPSEPEIPKETREDVKESSSLPFSLVQEKWSAFLEAVKRQNASLVLSLLNSVPKKSENGSIAISVRQSFHKERLEKPENRLTIEDALATIFGGKVRLTVEVTPDEPLPKDPLLDNALEMLGGKIVQ